MQDRAWAASFGIPTIYVLFASIQPCYRFVEIRCTEEDDRDYPGYPLRPRQLQQKTFTGEFTEVYALVVCLKFCLEIILSVKHQSMVGLLFSRVSCVIESALYVLVLLNPDCRVVKML